MPNVLRNLTFGPATFAFGIAFFIALTSLAQQARDGQYKRIHQQALELITSGKLPQAQEYLEGYAERAPEDAETKFWLAVVAAQSKDSAAAQEYFAEAMKLGLPVERFLAGPRDLTAALVALPKVKAKLEPWQNAPLHGPMVGDVGPSSVKLWVRTALAADVKWTVSTESAKHDPVTVKTTAASDFTAVANIDSLQPDTTYHYSVEINGTPVDEEFKFKTAPAAGTASKFVVAFGGGAGYVPENERMWTTIQNTKPDLLILLGDNVYSDAPENRAMQRYCYYRRQSQAEYRELLKHVPVYTIWDDHDFGTNDCWGGPEVNVPAWKPDVWEVFVQNWVNPDYASGARPGCWYSFQRGDVEFFFLDGRYYRTNPKIENPSMLGPAQLAWLKEAVSASTATVKVLCSPVPWDYRTKGDSKDTWNGFKAERGEIFGHLEKNKIEGVILMSADRHRSDAWKMEREGTYPLYEFNSSRLTNQHVHGPQKGSLFSYNKKQSFGRVTFDTVSKPPVVTYEVIDIDGKVHHTLEVNVDELK
jgi:alkaline phosphatase D